MAENVSNTTNAAQLVGNENATPKFASLPDGGVSIKDEDSKDSLLSPRKRDRNNSEARESSGSAKRQKGVAPIKSESATSTTYRLKY